MSTEKVRTDLMNQKLPAISSQTWFAAIGKAIVSQLQPSMLALLVMPWLVAFLFWGVFIYFSWLPITAAIGDFIFGGDANGWLMSLVNRWGMANAKPALSGTLTIVFFLPLAFATAMVLVAVLAMPAVIRHLSAQGYSGLEKLGSFSIAASIWNSAKALLVFIPGYLLTIPLWFVPIIGLAVPLFWWAWLNSRIMRFDSLVEHASIQERSLYIKQYAKQYWLIAAVIGLLNYIPPLFILTPVLSALAFAHFSLGLLRFNRAKLL
jgi:Etoposide-induced protein 2.4 (EI24)